jgi:hypothetical protein
MRTTYPQLLDRAHTMITPSIQRRHLGRSLINVSIKFVANKLLFVYIRVYSFNTAASSASGLGGLYALFPKRSISTEAPVVDACQGIHFASLGSVLPVFMQDARLLIPVFLNIKASFYIDNTSVPLGRCNGRAVERGLKASCGVFDTAGTRHEL